MVRIILDIPNLKLRKQRASEYNEIVVTQHTRMYSSNPRKAQILQHYTANTSGAQHPAHRSHPAHNGLQRITGLESLTRHKTLSTVCLRLCSDGFSICYSTMTLNCDILTPKINAFISVP